MSELSPETRAMLEAAREELQTADNPSQQELDKTLTAITATIAAGGAAAAGTAAASAVGVATKLSLTTKVVIGVATLATAGTLVVTQPWRADQTPPDAERPESTQLATPTPKAPAASTDQSVVSVEDKASAIEDEVVGTVSQPSERKTKRRPRPARSREVAVVADPLQLQQEFELLRKAQAARSAGDHSRALELLDAHKKRFPAGALSAERMATRALTLCDLEDRRLALRTARKFLRKYPRSPLASKVRQACLK